MIVVYMQDTLKLLGEFPKPSRVGQTGRGAYIVYEFPLEEVSPQDPASTDNITIDNNTNNR